MLKFSVSMCVYYKDNPKWFKIAIDSILNQTVVPNEVVLVVDGPIGKELNDIIDSFKTNKIFKIIYLEKNMGHGIARKTGLDNCTNNIVAIMDSDDISVPNRFELQIKQFENDKSISIVGGMISEFINEPTNVVGKRIVPINDNEIKKYMKKRCPMNLVTVMFKKNDIEKVGGFIDWFCEEDYYLWIRMAIDNQIFHNVEEILVNVRVGKDMYSRRGGLKYFKSEKKLQKYMLNNKIIGLWTYISNVSKRFIIQVLMPNRIRGWVFKKFARSK